MCILLETMGLGLECVGLVLGLEALSFLESKSASSYSDPTVLASAGGRKRLNLLACCLVHVVPVSV